MAVAVPAALCREKDNMHVVVLGCGRTGSTLARLLLQRGHSVAIIDRSRDAFRRYLGPTFEGTLVVGLGIDQDVLRKAGIERADVFLALTGGDNTNLTAAQIVKTWFSVPKVLCRVHDPLRADAYREMGIDTLCTTDLVVGMLFDFALGKPWDRKVSEYLESPVRPEVEL